MPDRELHIVTGAYGFSGKYIAWMLRHLPLFGIFGDGQYRLQPIYVDDLAQLAVEQGRSNINSTIDAIGPETFTYLELVQTIGKIIGKKRPIISVAPAIGYWAGRLLRKIVKDVIITRAEIEGLMQDLLYTSSAPAGETRLTDWAQTHADSLGKYYASELARRRDRSIAYKKIYLEEFEDEYMALERLNERNAKYLSTDEVEKALKL